MKEYTIEITETLQRQVTVFAENVEDAMERVRFKHSLEEIVLDAEDLVSIEFEYVND